MTIIALKVTFAVKLVGIKPTTTDNDGLGAGEQDPNCKWRKEHALLNP